MATEQTEQEFQDTPSSWAERLSVEFKAARDQLKSWHKEAKEIDKAYLCDHGDDQAAQSRWELFAADIDTKQAMLFGNTPKVSVSRSFSDANDDLARVGSTMLERLLNCDIQRDDDTYTEALGYAIQDRLLPGFGCARVHYVAEFESEKGPDEEPKVDDEGRPVERKVSERVDIDYTHWGDVLWGPCRVWHEVPWVAFKAEMSRADLVKRFGEEKGKTVPLNSKRPGLTDEELKKSQPWARADVWEVWHRETQKVYWYVEAHRETLDQKDDPLQLPGFFPCPRPMIARASTSRMVPRPDFFLAQGLYKQINDISTRIKWLVAAAKLRGAYAKDAPELEKLINGAGESEMVPVENWPAFMEKGGLRGIIEWLPLDAIVAAIAALREERRELVEMLRQVTGWSDIQRGQATTPGATATEQRTKAAYGSVRIQALQNEIARFATDLLKIKAHIIAKFFDAETIIEQSNVMRTPDAEMAQQAADFIKSNLSDYRIEVKPEAINLADFAQLKQEGTEAITGVATFMSAMGPLMQGQPQMMTPMLEVLKWFMSRIRGASNIESVLDQAIEQAQQAAQQPQQAPPPDPKLLVEQAKSQHEMAKIDKELQADLMRRQADVQARAAEERNQMEANVMEHARKQAISVSFKPQPGPTSKTGGPP